MLNNLHNAEEMAREVDDDSNGVPNAISVGDCSRIDSFMSDYSEHFHMVDVNENLLEDYCQCKCGDGCNERMKDCPDYFMPWACMLPFSLLSPLCTCHCVYFPLCMTDFLCIDKLGPCAFADFPPSIAESEWKVLLESNSIRYGHVLRLSLFRLPFNPIKMAVLNKLVEESNKSKFKIKHLNCVGCGIDYQKCQVLAGFIQNCPDLSMIDLSQNSVGNGGFLRILEVLSQQHKDKNKFGNVRVPSSQKDQTEPIKICHVNLGDNKDISYLGVIKACQILKNITFPILVTLSQNGLVTTNIEAAILELRDANDNVRFWIDDNSYRSWYHDRIQNNVSNGLNPNVIYMKHSRINNNFQQ